ncbi:hypothetical protein FACS189491_00230 [Spirochaetia bacterium]|nr:hypothetical protein FACS189491_00230 [Spirochaetia bacterium]
MIKKTTLLCAAIFAGLLFLGSCATAPKVVPLSPDAQGVEYLPLAPGGLVYVFADVDAARPILDRFSLGGISGGQATEILDRTRYAVAAVYPKESSQNVQAAAWGNYPSASAGLSFAFSKDWKKRKSASGKFYWYSERNSFAVSLNAGQAFVSMGAPGAKPGGVPAANSKNPLDPFAPPPGIASPEGFAEFRRGAALSFWVEDPAVPLNRFLNVLTLPLQIPAEQLFISLYPASPEYLAEPGSAGYEAHVRIKTPTASQARALVTIMSMARLFASNAAGAEGLAAPSSVAGLIPILFAHPPEQDGTFLNIRTAPMDAGEIALLFGMFSIYSTQN